MAASFKKYGDTVLEMQNFVLARTFTLFSSWREGEGDVGGGGGGGLRYSVISSKPYKL